MEYDGSYIGQLRTDDCIEYPPRVVCWTHSQRRRTKVYQEGMRVGLTAGVGVAIWIGLPLVWAIVWVWNECGWL